MKITVKAINVFLTLICLLKENDDNVVITTDARVLSSLFSKNVNLHRVSKFAC